MVHVGSVAKAEDKLKGGVKGLGFRRSGSMVCG